MIDNPTYRPETVRASKILLLKREPSETDRLLGEIKELERVASLWRAEQYRAQDAVHEIGRKLTELREELYLKIDQLTGADYA